MKRILIIPVLAGAGLALAGCNADVSSVTSAICADAAAVQASPLKLNANEALALKGIITDCAITAQGTSFGQANLATTIIVNAVQLQSSGLLTSVKLKALAPAERDSLTRIRMKWERIEEANGF